MPKALWSTDEKNLFFEALNEYGKDFDAITAYICAKMKKKGMPDVNLKTKTQVSHFYYRTWHKLSKHVHFDESKYGNYSRSCCTDEVGFWAVSLQHKRT